MPFLGRKIRRRTVVACHAFGGVAAGLYRPSFIAPAKTITHLPKPVMIIEVAVLQVLPALPLPPSL